MKQLHQNLEQSFPWYRKWHESRNYKPLHYILLILAIAVTGAIVVSSNAVKAAPTIYYVATNGSDTAGTGSINEPWRTVGKACNEVVTSGDTIHIKAGTYTESQKCNLAVGVSVVGEGKNNTIVKSSVTGTWSSYMELQSPNGTNGNQTISNFTLDGLTNTTGNASGTWIGIWITGRSNVIVRDMKLINFFDSATIFAGNHANQPTNWTDGPYAIGNKFYNNDGTNCSGIIPDAGFSGSGCLMIGWQDGMEIYNNNLVSTARPLEKNGWPLKYWNNGFLKGVKIHNNTLIKAPFQGTSPWNPPDWDFAVELFNVQGMEFNNNYVQGAVDINYIYKGPYTYGFWAHHNTLDHAVANYSHAESGFIFEFRAENVIVENNTINNRFVGISYNARAPGNTGGYNYNCGTGGCSAILNNIIRNNVFSNVYSAGGASGGIIIQTEGGTNNSYIDNMQIYNNTFVAKSGQPSPDGIDFTQQNNGGVAKNVFIRNNIFQGFGNRSISANTATTQSNILITHNDYYNTAAPVWTGGGVTINNNPNVIPGFISTTNFNLQTNPLSALIDAGINVGLPFNGVAPDIGYAETGASAPDTTPPTVTSTNPVTGSSNVAINVTPILIFSENLNGATVTSSTAYITQGGNAVQAAVAHNNGIVTLTPTNPLNANTSYMVTLVGGGAGCTTCIKDLAGNPLVSNYTVTFTTAVAANTPPIANAGADKTITLPTTSTTMNGTASDPGGAVASTTWSKVAGPTSFTITNPASLTTTITGLSWGTYTFRLTVVDNGTPALTTTDDVQVIVRDTTNPTISLTAPTGGTVLGSITLSATANDATPGSGVDHVDFHIDGVYTSTIGTVANSPYRVSWNSTTVPNGTHTITARAYDKAGNFATSGTVSVTVNNDASPAPDNIPPTVSITSPTGGNVTGNVLITANAGDNVAVSNVKFYDGTTLIATDSCGSGPTCNLPGPWQYEALWNTTGLSGSHALKAVAYDTTGNVTTSAIVTVTVGTTPTGDWTFCADEWGTCTYTGTKEVRYGAGSTFATLILPGPVQCNNTTFGDPLPGEDKVCQYKNTTTGGGSDTTWNPNDKSTRINLSNNNLTASRGNGIGIVRATKGKSSGKWYWEVKLNTAGDQFVGVANLSAGKNAILGSNRYGWSMVMDDGVKFHKGNQGFYGTAGSNGDTVSVLLDMDNKAISFWKNCSSFGPAFINLSGILYPAWGSQYQSTQGTANFGASAFTCSVPAGYNSGIY